MICYVPRCLRGARHARAGQEVNPMRIGQSSYSLLPAHGRPGEYQLYKSSPAVVAIYLHSDNYQRSDQVSRDRDRRGVLRRPNFAR